MGGGGGSISSSGAWGSPAGGSSGVDCPLLVFEAAVMSPDPAVVGTIKIGLLCDVELSEPPVQVCLYVRNSKSLLGAITSHWDDLTRCIGDGYEYEAEIVALNPTRVQIRPCGIQHR